MARGFQVVAGLDEAGRGPWAGPVVAAAVVLEPDNIPAGLNDSKKLTPEKRQALFPQIMERAIVGIAQSEPERIDRCNILQASLWAMKQAEAGLRQRADYALIDGNKAPELPCPGECVVKGDGRSLSIAAASIVAKVTRDRLMIEIARDFPDYGFERHKGYGTRQHQLALARFGPCPHHRRSFAPIRALLETTVG